MHHFVYCNGKTDREAFDQKLEFDVKVIPYKGDDSWIEPTIIKARECLLGSEIPKPTKECDYCLYYNEVRKLERLGLMSPIGTSSGVCD